MFNNKKKLLNNIKFVLIYKKSSKQYIKKYKKGNKTRFTLTQKEVLS